MEMKRAVPGEISVDILNLRRLPIGAEFFKGKGTHFRVWAPRAEKVFIVIEKRVQDRLEMPEKIELEPEQDGYFSLFAPQAGAGTLYRFQLDVNDELLPDPASRFQPSGPFGPSEVIDPDEFAWTDKDWAGVDMKGQVIYEMHIGTFTPEGTWKSAAKELPELAKAGITLIEVMPVADFPGRFGWGYDGVNIFAPTRLYGRPEDFKGFVDAAHACKIGVILDVVYNHLGPEGCFLTKFSRDYFSEKNGNDWGSSINYDGIGSRPIREFFIANAGYWTDEFHLDGLRLDATQAIHDSSRPHILTEITENTRKAALPRKTAVIAENEQQDPRVLKGSKDGGFGMDAIWNDDFHHAMTVALTGRRDAYYSDYNGTPQEILSCIKWGFLFQGQYFQWLKRKRGGPVFHFAPRMFVNFLQNHDQIANSLDGLRINEIEGKASFRASTALLLLAPQTPMLFQGQEFGSTKPFLFFSDLGPELMKSIRAGRAGYLSHFKAYAQPEARAAIPDPSDENTFLRSKLDLAEREKNSAIYSLHKDLLKIRRDDPVISAQERIDGAVIGKDAVAIRYFGKDNDDRLLIVNFGMDFTFMPSPEPLIAPPEGKDWALMWSSEHVRYGGSGALDPVPDAGAGWNITGKAAVLLKPR